MQTMSNGKHQQLMVHLVNWRSACDKIKPGHALKMAKITKCPVNTYNEGGANVVVKIAHMIHQQTNGLTGQKSIKSCSDM